ncbi:hypothetical protein BC832DRAFT_404418 [Gaertneriomyces semiglobifer]|nr:hypothetical protein BC832DRAFT_404418 [Gaertneriomyces semiglobifer]
MDREIRDSWDLTLERTPSRSSPPTDLQSQSRGRLTARPSQRFAPSPLRQSQDSRRPSLSKIDTSVATVTGDDSPGSGSFRASPTSTRASSPRGSVHSLRSMFQRPKKSLAAVLGRLGYAAPAEGYFFDTTRFDAAKVGSFAIYLGDCSTLLERSSEWNSIDLLVLDFQNLRDLWETPYATRLCGGLSHSQSYDALGTTSVGSFDADVKPPPRALHKSSSTSSIRSFQTSSSVGSRLSRISRFWRSRSATSLKDLVERDMDTTPLSENFCSIVLARVSHLVVSVNINSLYEEYKHTVQTAGTSFTQHVTTYLAQGLALMPSAVSGFLFTDCKKWLSAYSKDLAAEKIAKLVHALRESTDEEWHQPLIFLDTDIGWGRIRDEINGLLVANVFMDGRGGRKMLFGEERQALKAFTTKLSIEFSLRSDFLIMNSEAIPSTPSAALLRSHVQWATGLKCVPWYTTSLGYDQVSDVKPMEFNEVSEDGIFEMASNDDVLRCKDTVDINIAFLRARKVGLEITHEGWANVVNPASSIPRDFLDALREGAYTDGIPECDDDLMASNPLLPEPDSYVEIKQITQSRRASGAGDLLRTGSDDQAATEPLIPSVYDFGLDWQGPRYRNGVCNAVLTVMFELLDKKLLASARYNIDDADASKNGDELPDFMSFVKLLNDMVERPNRATSWLMSLLSEATVKAALTELGQFLVEGKISVWLPTKAAFLSATNNSPHIQIWGLAEERDGVLHMFIADNSLRWGEVVLHLFMKWRLGWETRRCIVIEAMYEAQTLEVQSLTLPIPARLNQQVDTSCPSELLAIVRDSEPVLDELRCAIGTILSANCASYLSAVCCYLRRRAEWRLVDQREYLDSVRRGLSAGYTPDNAIETRMVQFVSRCTLQAHGRKRICAVAKAIEAEMRKRGGTLPVSPMLGGPAELWTLCYIFAVFWKAIRRVGYETLIIELMNMNPLFLPEADQVAVSLEMVTTNKNLVTVFGVDSLTMGEIIHPILRATSLKELNHIEKSRGQHPVPVSDSADISKDIDDGNVLAGAESTEDAADSGMTAFRKSILNAYIYVYPIFLDIILLASLGSGIFATDRMDAETRELTSLVLLVMFPITGAVMNSIGRTVTYYYFQKSIPLMVSAFYRRLSAAIIIFTAAGIILGGVNFYRTGDIVLSALGLLYSVVFGMFMLFFSVLVILREPDEYFYHSRGPLAILKMLLILIPNAFLCRFVLPKDINRLVPFALYIGSLLLATVYMAFTYTSVTGQYLRWPHIVKVPQKRQILELYKVSYPPPQQSGADDQGAVARATRRWERDALEWYANVTVEAMERKRADDETMESVKERLSTWYWENLLMKWYIQRLGVHAPKPFTGEWDTLIKQGIVELKKKFTVEKMNRGGILFDNEFPAICFGFLYFILLFVDKWTVLFVTGRAVMFLRNDVIGASNTDSLLGATVFLLLTSGVLELTLARYYEHHKRIPMLSVGKSKGPNSLIENHKDAVQWIFASELRRFLFALVLFLIPITLAVLFLGDRQDQGLKMTIFGLSSFGFTGLLIGLFIKLFITSLEVAVNVFMTVALLIGIGATTAILHVTGAVEYASLATAITGWIFALGCIISQQKEKLRSVHYRVRVSPALSSSGQRYMGQTETAYTSAARDRLAAELMSNIKDAVRIQSELGGNWIIRESIQRSREQIATLPAGHIIHSAFPSALALLHELMEEMASARIVMLRNKKPLTAAGVRYSAISVREHRSGMLYVFVPPKDDDLSEIDDFQLLLEALIHEFLESRGQSHATACVSELLVGVSVGAWSQRLVDVPVPRRVATQRIDDTSRAILWHNSRNVVQGKAALGIDVDRMWNTKFTQRERVWFVDLSRIWWRSFQDGFDVSCRVWATLIIKYLGPNSVNSLVSFHEV